MGLETQFTNIGDLNPSWPTDADDLAQGAAQIRGVKSALQGNVQGSGTQTTLFNGSVNKPLGGALLTTPNGVQVRDTVAAGVAAALELLSAANVSVGKFEHYASNVRISSKVSGDAFRVTVQTAAGTQDGVIVSGADGSVQVLFGGVVAVTSRAGGLSLNNGAGAGSIVVDVSGNVSVGGTAVALLFGAAVAVLTTASGAIVRGSTAALIALQTAAAVALGSVSADAAGNVYLEAATATGVTVATRAAGVTLFGSSSVLHTWNIGGALAASLTASILTFTGQRLTGLGTPTGNTDAATKAYVDTLPGMSGAFCSAAGVLSDAFGARTLTVSRPVPGQYDYTASAGANVRNVQVTLGGTVQGSVNIRSRAGLNFQVFIDNGSGNTNFDHYVAFV